MPLFLIIQILSPKTLICILPHDDMRSKRCVKEKKRYKRKKKRYKKEKKRFIKEKKRYERGKKE